MTSTIQAEADRLAEYGYAVVRCAGKAPRLTKAGLLDARKGKAPRVGAGENIALVAGSGTVPLVVVDIDDLDHPVYAWLLSTYPGAAVCETGSGCAHVYLRDPDPSATGAESVRWKGSEAYSVRRGRSVAVLPPSIHPDTGRPYVWRQELGHPDVLPTWDAACQARHSLYRLAAEVASAPPGGRQNRLFAAACRAYRLGLPEDVVTAALCTAAAACGLEGEQDVDRQLERAQAAAAQDVTPETASDKHVALAILQTLGLVRTVGDDTWAYTPSTGLWRALDKRALARAAHDIGGRVCADGDVVKVTAGRANGIAETVRIYSDDTGLPGDGRALVMGDRTVTWGAGGLRVTEHDPSFGATESLPFQWDGPSETPIYDDYIATCETTGPELLLEWLGVCLLGQSTRLGRALRLHGERGTGKSTWLELATSIVPRSIALAPSEIKERFGAAQLDEHVLLCVVDEMGRDSVVREDAWKSIVHGHPVAVERKRIDARTIRPIAGWLAAGNTWPAAPGLHDAFFDRWCVVAFRKIHRGEDTERHDLLSALRSEIPALTRRAILAGAAALDRGTYSGMDASAALVRAWRATDSVGQWLEECCEREGCSTIAPLYQAYETWTRTSGLKGVSRPELHRRLLSLGVTQTWTKDRNKALALSLRREA